MSLRPRIALVTIGIALMCSANVSAARAQQKVLTNDQAQIVDAVNTILTALRTEDPAKLASVIAPDFLHIRWRHPRLNGESVTAAIEAQHVAGRRYVTEELNPWQENGE